MTTCNIYILAVCRTQCVKAISLHLPVNNIQVTDIKHCEIKFTHIHAVTHSTTVVCPAMIISVVA